MVKAAAVVGALLCAPLGVTSVPEDDDYEFTHSRFQLLNNCLGMDLVVEEMDRDAKKLGLTREVIQNAAESRLRAAGLYNEDVLDYLYVHINIVSPAWSADIEFNKPLTDNRVSSMVYFGTTWERGSFGTSESPAFILAQLGQHLDAFVVEYLRVNEAGCRARADWRSTETGAHQ